MPEAHPPSAARRRSPARGAAPLVAAAVLAAGCREPAGEPTVVARVGERAITVEEVVDHARGVGASLAARGDRGRVLRTYVQDLVDRELLLLEARGRGYEGEDVVARRLELGRRQKVVERYVTEVLVAGLEIPEEELRRRFAGSRWSRVLRLDQIEAGSREEALQLRGQIDAGRSFDELARALGQEPLGEGDRGGWYGLGDLEEIPRAVAAELFDLERGTVSGPHDVDGVYRLYRVTDTAPAPDRYLASFVMSETMRESGRRWQALTDSLREARNLRFHVDAIELLMARKPPGRMRPILLGSGEVDRPLCSFDGGVVTVRDFADVYNQYRLFHRVTFDPEGIREYTRRRLLRDALTYAVAKEAGYDRQADIVRWARAKENALVVEELRRREVVDPARVDSADARDYYERHPQTFGQPAETRAVELRVPTRPQARELLDRARAGEDLQELAVKHTTRDPEHRGRMVVRDLEGVRRRMGALYDSMAAAPVGELRGPVAVDGGWSVFRVVERLARGVQPFDQVRDRAEWHARREVEARRFADLVDRLRRQHAAVVIVYEDRLAEWAGEEGGG